MCLDVCEHRGAYLLSTGSIPVEHSGHVLELYCTIDTSWHFVVACPGQHLSENWKVSSGRYHTAVHHMVAECVVKLLIPTLSFHSLSLLTHSIINSLPPFSLSHTFSLSIATSLSQFSLTHAAMLSPPLSSLPPPCSLGHNLSTYLDILHLYPWSLYCSQCWYGRLWCSFQIIQRRRTVP